MSELELIGIQRLEIEKLKKENKSLIEKSESSRKAEDFARYDARTVRDQIEGMIPEGMYGDDSLGARIRLMVEEIQKSRITPPQETDQ